ncbi:hypothetical protein GMRT_11465 [Giardia muris]|uniref:Uncharacterized protein n=1 Tax=Giardia muris TaxID=5742 RepID=A0A4Z1TB57_GIAMU|nr:hypothetical protein GMRT_11465 [Giardia muris]|eukprot:TNJ29769.1 hypothetical protein GMRT_11465 [Giardia muris]
MLRADLVSQTQRTHDGMIVKLLRGPPEGVKTIIREGNPMTPEELDSFFVLDLGVETPTESVVLKREGLVVHPLVIEDVLPWPEVSQAVLTAYLGEISSTYYESPKTWNLEYCIVSLNLKRVQPSELDASSANDGNKPRRVEEVQRTIRTLSIGEYQEFFFSYINSVMIRAPYVEELKELQQELIASDTKALYDERKRLNKLESAFKQKRKELEKEYCTRLITVGLNLLGPLRNCYTNLDFRGDPFVEIFTDIYILLLRDPHAIELRRRSYSTDCERTHSRYVEERVIHLVLYGALRTNITDDYAEYISSVVAKTCEKNLCGLTLQTDDWYGICLYFDLSFSLFDLEAFQLSLKELFYGDEMDRLCNIYVTLSKKVPFHPLAHILTAEAYLRANILDKAELEMELAEKQYSTHGYLEEDRERLEACRAQVTQVTDAKRAQMYHRVLK